MKQFKSFFSNLAIVAAVLGIYYLIQTPLLQDRLHAIKGKPIEVEKLTYLTPSQPTGQNISLIPSPNNLSLITFGAGWCDMCKKEKHLLSKLSKALKSKPVQIFGVVSSEIRSQLKLKDIFPKENYLYGYDSDGSIARALGVLSLPQTLLIDEAGRIVFKAVGMLKENDLKSIMEHINKRQ